MSKVAICMADGCEEIEGLTVVDVLRRGGMDIDTVSISGDPYVTGSHNIAFFCQYGLLSKYSSLYKSPSFLSKRSCCSGAKDTFNVSGLRNVKLPISRLRVRLIIWANV